MPTKKPKKKDTKSSNPLRALVIALAVTFAVLGCIAWLHYIFDLQYQQKLLKEDVTFARVETFVNTAKVRLEQEFPEGEWRVESRCSAPGVKGPPMYYECSYRVLSNAQIGLNDTGRLKSIGASIADNEEIYTGYREGNAFSFDVVNQGLPSSCGFYSANESDSVFVSVGCDAISAIARYPLPE